jgi:hypothetical protein
MLFGSLSTSTPRPPSHPEARPRRRSHCRQGRRLGPSTSSSDPLCSPLLLWRFESTSTSPACRKTSSLKLRNSMPLPLTPDIDLPAARATIFPETRTPLDSTNLPTRAAGYPLSLFSRPLADGTACLSAGGATASVIRAPDGHGNPNADRPLAPSSTAIQRRLGAFTAATTAAASSIPTALPLDVSIHLGTLSKWEGHRVRKNSRWRRYREWTRLL